MDHNVKIEHWRGLIFTRCWHLVATFSSSYNVYCLAALTLSTMSICCNTDCCNTVSYYTAPCILCCNTVSYYTVPCILHCNSVPCSYTAMTPILYIVAAQLLCPLVDMQCQMQARTARKYATVATCLLRWAVSIGCNAPLMDTGLSKYTYTPCYSRLSKYPYTPCYSWIVAMHHCNGHWWMSATMRCFCNTCYSWLGPNWWEKAAFEIHDVATPAVQ